MITSVTAPTIEKAPFPDMYEIHYVTVYDGNIVDLTDEEYSDNFTLVMCFICGFRISEQ